MELLIIFAIVGWVVSFMASAAKKSAEVAKRRQQADPRHQGSGQTMPASPRRVQKVFQPEDARQRPELPPIHWDGECEEDPETQRQRLEGYDHHRPTSEIIMEGFNDDRPRPGQIASEADRQNELDDEPTAVPGLRLAFDKGSLLEGVVYSEILGRIPRRRNM